jgi:paraquat-inducible protein A
METTDPHSRLIACPECDALYEANPALRLECRRCHRLLVAPDRRAGLGVILLSLLSALLIWGAVTQPFLSIERFWVTRDATLLEAAFAFEGPFAWLSLAVLGFVLVLPALRLGLSLYVLGPLVAGRSPLPGAMRAFRWTEALKPWSMAEIFALGAGVALVKIVALAEVTVGPAFWMFALLVVAIWVQDRLTCRFSVWEALER